MRGRERGEKVVGIGGGERSREGVSGREGHERWKMEERESISF